MRTCVGLIIISLYNGETVRATHSSGSKNNYD
jgi:hypothetical protein